MEEATEQAVTRVVKMMHDQLGEQLTTEDMARVALFSKFHFCRIFREVTGVSPGRFLAALRIQEAKRLLVSTSLSVADISNMVGYASIGTFSSRFKSTVGVAPTTYRQHDGFTLDISADNHLNAEGARTATIQGEIFAPATGETGFVFVGLFTGQIPQGKPARCTILHRPGPYVLEEVPQGTWHLLVHSVTPALEEVSGEDPACHQVPWVGSHGPITVLPDTITSPADVRLRPMRALDPPVLLALLDVRLVALSA
jgi:AraC-like DNA-binding protein